MPIMHAVFLGAAIALSVALVTLCACLVLLRRSRRREDELWSLTGEGLAEVTLDGRIQRASAALAELVGAHEDTLAGRPLSELVHPLDHEQLLAALNPLAPEGLVRTSNVRLRSTEGSWAQVRLRARVDRGRSIVDVALGEPGGASQAASAFERVFSMAPIGMAVIADDGIVRRVNRRMIEMIGADRTGASLETLVSADDLATIREQLARLVARELHAVTLRVGLRNADGSSLPVVFSVALLRDDAGEPRQYIVQVQDVGATEQLQQEVERATSHDSLTGLLNRAALLPLLHELPGKPTGLAVIDVDGLSEVNDTYGMAAGDVVLEAVAARLEETVGDHGALARVGADEFAVLVSEAMDARALADECLAAICSRPVDVAGAHLGITACAGIAHSGDLLLYASEALAEAKRRGSNSVVVFDAGMSRARTSHMSWADKVRRGLGTDRFLLHAQPIVSVVTGQTVQHELLLRMRDEDGTVVRPNAFLAPARRHGLTSAIDDWVLTQAIETIHASLATREPLDLCVNLSAESLADRAFLGRVVSLLMDAPEAGQHLILEVTERVALSDRGEAQRLMAQLGEFGCRFTLDDFGAGTAALRYLKALPVEYVKLDGQLTRGMPADEDDRAIAAAVVQAAHALSKTVVAECVEDEAILGVVRELGIELAQGLHLGRPLPLADLVSAQARR